MEWSPSYRVGPVYVAGVVVFSECLEIACLMQLKVPEALSNRAKGVQLLDPSNEGRHDLQV